MKIRMIDSLPSKHQKLETRSNNKLKNIAQSFYDSDSNYAEVEFYHGEYTSSVSLCSGLRKAIAILGLPISAEIIQGGVYLRRLD